MSNSEVFLLALTVIFVVPWLVWRLGRTEYYAPLVVVQIICGILLGPGIGGAIAPKLYSFVFNPQVIGALGGIATWAVMLFVWVAGLELNLADAWQNRRETAVTSGLALLVPLLFGSLAGAALLYLDTGWLGSGGQAWQFVVGIGMACAVTALPILVLLMEKLEILREPLGQRILRYASLDDIAIWGVLALILLDWSRLGQQAIFLAAFIGARWLYARIMPRLGMGDRWFAGLVWLLGCGLMADWSGLHYMVGAFLAGAATEASWFDRARIDRFRETVLIALMPVFFLSTGLRTSWTIGGVQVLGAAILLLVAGVAGKHVGLRLAGRICGWEPGEASLIAWLLQTKALIMIIFVGILLDKHIISPQAFTAMLIMAVMSTMLTVPIAAPALARLLRR